MKLTILIAAAQLIDAYIRFLPFSKKISAEVRRKIFIASTMWSIASIVIYKTLFDFCGLNAATYKFIFLTGWIPYFLIAVKNIPWGLPQHVFVFGMAAICSLVQHSIIASLLLLKFGESLTLEELTLFESEGYLAMFLLSLPLLKKFFVKLLPNREFFDLRPQGIYIAIFPLIIVAIHMIRLADDVFVHTWAERLSRIYLPVVFFFFYRYILSAAKTFYDLQRLERNKILLEDKLMTLKDYNEQLQANRKKISVIRHDLRQNYNRIYELLESGDIEQAREYIRKQEKTLETSAHE